MCKEKELSDMYGLGAQCILKERSKQVKILLHLAVDNPVHSVAQLELPEQILPPETERSARQGLLLGIWRFS